MVDGGPAGEKPTFPVTFLYFGGASRGEKFHGKGKSLRQDSGSWHSSRGSHVFGRRGPLCLRSGRQEWHSYRGNHHDGAGRDRSNFLSREKPAGCNRRRGNPFGFGYNPPLRGCWCPIPDESRPRSRDRGVWRKGKTVC